MDMIIAGEIDLIVNAPTLGDDSSRDGFLMRRAAIERNIPVYTSMDTFRAWSYAQQNISGTDVTDIYDLKKYS